MTRIRSVVATAVTLAAVGIVAMTLTAQEAEVPATPAERIATLSQRVATEPRPDSYFELGRLQFDQGDPAAAFHALAKGVKLAPSGHHIQSYFLHMLDKSAFKGRIELLKSLKAELPDYPPLLHRLAVLYQGQGKDSDAEALLLRWRTLRPESVEPHARLGEFYRATKQLKKAANSLEKVREIVGESSYALRRLGVIYRELGELERSVGALTLANEQVEARDDLVALVELGNTYMVMKQPKNAIEPLEQVVALDSGSPRFWLLLAQAQAQADSVDARGSFTQAIALDKFNLDAQLGMAELLLSKGEVKAALPHLREASSRNDRDPDLHFKVGETAIKAGDMALAQREYAKLKRIGSKTLAKQLGGLITAAGSEVAP